MALPSARALGAGAPRALHCVSGLGRPVTIANACAWGLCPLARRNGIPALPRVRCAPACAGRVIPLRCALHPPFSPKGRVAAAELRNLQFKGTLSGNDEGRRRSGPRASPLALAAAAEVVARYLLASRCSTSQSPRCDRVSSWPSRSHRRRIAKLIDLRFAQAALRQANVSSRLS